MIHHFSESLKKEKNFAAMADEFYSGRLNAINIVRYNNDTEDDMKMQRLDIDVQLTINNKAQEKLIQYAYPGNVRELKAVVELACVMATDGTIRPENFTFTSLVKREDFLQGEKTLDEYNLEIVTYYMNKYEQNIRVVAEKLGIGRTTVYRMLKRQNGSENGNF